jgi:hypothetical protein
VLLGACQPLFFNWHSSTRAGQTDTRDFAHDLLNSVEPYGVLITVGDNDTFPVWYAQEVEGIRRDVVLVNTSLANTDWYPRQIIRRPIYEYDKENGPAVYRDKEWPKPTRPPLTMTLDEVDAIELVVGLNGPQEFKVEGSELRATVNKRDFWKADYLILRMLQDSYGERSIYMSRTAGSTPTDLGLRPYLLTQGLAEKVMYSIPQNPGRDTLQVDDSWLDVKRSKILWDSVYLAPESLIRKNRWTDFPSQGIPYLYVATGITLGHGLQMREDFDLARPVLLRAANVAEAVRLSEGVGEADLPARIRRMAGELSVPTLDLPVPAETGSAAGRGRGG